MQTSKEAERFFISRTAIWGIS